MSIRRSTAEVATARPARYGKQLVGHLGRHGGGEWSADEETGWIQFGDGRSELACRSDVLVLTVALSDEADAEALPRLEDVVGRHLVRFGEKDELTVQWQREDGSAGSHQPAEADPTP